MIKICDPIFCTSGLSCVWRKFRERCVHTIYTFKLAKGIFCLSHNSCVLNRNPAYVLTLWHFFIVLLNSFYWFFYFFYIKWGWKTEKSSIWSGNSEMFGKKLAARGNKQESIPDPLLSPFICNVPIPNYNSNHPDENSSLSDKDKEIHKAKRYGSFSLDILLLCRVGITR